MRTITTSAFSILLALCFIAEATAQSQKDIAAAQTTFEKEFQRFSATTANLSQMSASVDEPAGYSAISRFLSAGDNVSGQVITVTTVSQIYTQMIDPRDIATVRGYVSIHCEALRRAVALAVNNANQALPKLTSVALIQEMTKARDQLGQIGQSHLCKIVPAAKLGSSAQ